MRITRMILVAFFLLVVIAIGYFWLFGKSEKRIVFDRKASSVESVQENRQEPAIDSSKIVSPDINIDNEEGEDVPDKTEILKKNETESSFRIENKLVSSGFSQASGRKIDTIVIHSTYNSLGGDEYDVNKIIGIYKDYGVSAHYLIDRKGKIYRLVEEKNVAYHAGESKVPDNRTNVNNFSIGIELIANKNDGYEKEQYEAVIWLVEDIKKGREIKYVLGHKDIAPDRKDDPWKFDFSKLK